jgi:hypothetical protein
MHPSAEPKPIASPMHKKRIRQDQQDGQDLSRSQDESGKNPPVSIRRYPPCAMSFFYRSFE